VVGADALTRRPGLPTEDGLLLASTNHAYKMKNRSSSSPLTTKITHDVLILTLPCGHEQRRATVKIEESNIFPLVSNPTLRSAPLDTTEATLWYTPPRHPYCPADQVDGTEDC